VNLGSGVRRWLGGYVGYCYCNRFDINVIVMVICLYWNAFPDIKSATFVHLDIIDLLDIPATLGNLHVIGTPN